jgi:hypothetical protein
VTHGRHALALHELREKFLPDPLIKSKPEQSLVQVWFAGAHSDVGGGYETSALSDHSLLWMAEEATRLDLSVDYGLIPIEPDVTSDIHQQLNAPHALFRYECRSALHDLREDPDSDTAATHWIHPSALRRLGLRDAASAAYPFSPAINAQLERVDILTREFAVRTACRWSTPPDMEPSNMTPFDIAAQHVQDFATLLHAMGAGDSNAVQDLTQALALARLKDGREGVMALGRAFDRCHAEIATAMACGEQVLVPLDVWIKRTQAGLGAIVAELPEGAIRSDLEKVLLRDQLEFGLPEKGTTRKVVKA